jgi:hypothetical protein
VRALEAFQGGGVCCFGSLRWPESAARAADESLKLVTGFAWRLTCHSPQNPTPKLLQGRIGQLTRSTNALCLPIDLCPPGGTAPAKLAV